MKRTLVLLLVLGLVAGALTAPAAAGKKKKKKKPKKIERTLSYRYENPAFGAPGVGGVTTLPGITSGLGETYLSVVQVDDISPLPSVRLSWDTDGDGTNDTGVNICGGQTEEPIAIPEATEFGVFPYIAPGPGCPTAFNTMGTIEFTFSNMP